MKTIKFFTLLALSLLFFNSCINETETDPEPLGDYENGFFVINEGGFGSGNADLTFISNDYTAVLQDVYHTVNSEALGDIAQDVLMYEDKAYIVMNASNKVVVVNRYTMERIAVIEGTEIANPSFIVAYNGKAYLSNWGVGSDPSDDTLVVIDLASDTIENTISVGSVPNRLAVVNDKLYVEIQGWYPNTENKVQVVDLETNSVIKELVVGYYPHSLHALNDKVYVLSNNKIVEIDTSNDTVSRTLVGGDNDYFNHLASHEDDLYYSLNSNIYKWSISDLTLPTESVIEVGENIYGLNIKDNLLYTSISASDYVSEGKLKIYDVKTVENTNTITTGINPKGVVFN